MFGLSKKTILNVKIDVQQNFIVVQWEKYCNLCVQVYEMENVELQLTCALYM